MEHTTRSSFIHLHISCSFLAYSHTILPLFTYVNCSRDMYIRQWRISHIWVAWWECRVLSCPFCRVALSFSLSLFQKEATSLLVACGFCFLPCKSSCFSLTHCIHGLIPIYIRGRPQCHMKNSSSVFKVIRIILGAFAIILVVSYVELLRG